MMYFIVFILGGIVGILVRDIKFKIVTEVEELKKARENKGETQFLEPVTMRDKFKEAKTVDDILENFNK